MGMTIAEKIIAAAAGVDSVKPGDIHTVTLDRMMSNDGTTHLTVDMYNNKLKNPRIADPKKLVFIVDHNVPSDSPKTAASQKKMRDFAKENGIDFWEGKGVCHQVMMENYVRPGELIFGADSHTCSYGALGAFGTGVGCTDFLYGMVTGQSWVLVPESVKFNLIGELPEGVYARDLILTIIGQVGANGCNYQVMEFTGEGAKTLSISDRIALCNMAVEAGAKTGIFEADEKAMEYLKEHGREPKAVFHSDPDAHYIKEYTIDLSKVEPVVAKPDFVDNLSPAKEVRGIKIDEAFLGSCNNGRIEDLRVGAEVIKGKKVAPLVRFLVVPASAAVYEQALKEGIIDTRPWKVFGEGPIAESSVPINAQGFNEGTYNRATSKEIRFTQTDKNLYAIVLAWPEEKQVIIKSLAAGSEQYPGKISRIDLLGYGKVTFTRTDQGLIINMPDKRVNEIAPVFKIRK